MINEKDVIRMKIPFPNIHEKLALQAHMYICGHKSGSNYDFIKCQTLKPWMLGNPVLKHYIDEPADLSRNPFKQISRIDCDKLFSSASASYDKQMRTPSRPDICQELYDDVLKELSCDGYINIKLNEDELMAINPYIQKIDT